MKQVIFDFIQWQHNNATIYTALNDPKLRPANPTVIRLTNGFTVIYMPHSDPALGPTTMSVGPSYIYEVSEPLPAIKAQPEIRAGISESTLLKAIAITKDSSLALELIKD